ncbi:Uncharacterized protein dnl_45650 [Desulfonema limicola]|uniref:Uncharacterized protein n=1 Tax=Desulfonema limicola TaxID=45656 RepID=A0A975BBI4_9BACT|nr:Uncharacterized protein dnl_45650 [Desulfonema limicola]
MPFIIIVPEQGIHKKSCPGKSEQLLHLQVPKAGINHIIQLSKQNPLIIT